MDLPHRGDARIEDVPGGLRARLEIFGMYPDDLCTVELLCDNEVMRSVIDRFGEDVSTVTADDGHFKAIVEVAPSPPFFAWVFTFCGKIRILGPEEVLDEMRGMAAWLQ